MRKIFKRWIRRVSRVTQRLGFFSVGVWLFNLTVIGLSVGCLNHQKGESVLDLTFIFETAWKVTRPVIIGLLLLLGILLIWEGLEKIFH